MSPIVTTWVTSFIGTLLVPWLLSKGITVSAGTQATLAAFLIGSLTAVAHWIHLKVAPTKPTTTLAAKLHTLTALLTILMVLMLTACTSTGQLKPLALSPQQLQQLQGQVCAVVKADLLLLQSPSGRALVGPAAQAKIESTIAPTATAVCNSGATVDLTSLQAFNNTALPALIEIVQSVPAIPNQPAIVLALQLAQVALPPLVNSAIAASQSSVAVK